MAELSDLGRGFTQSDFQALIEEAYQGLWARPRVLRDFVGALRRKALRILRLRAFAEAAASHRAARKARAQVAPVLNVDDRPTAEALGEFRQMLSASIKPLHERSALERLRRLHDEGLSLVVLQPCSKIAVHKWLENQQSRPALRTLEQDLAREAGRDLGVLCGPISGVVVLDLDTTEDVQWAYASLPLTPWRTRTARGEHWYFQLSLTAGEPPATPWWRGDLRAHGKYVVAPGALHPDGKRYEAIGDWSVAKRALPVWEFRPNVRNLGG
jgi:hypothetical protein